MNELSIEEKAKRYDEAKERMKDFLKEWEDCGAVGEAMEKARNVFPELKENKDERIRKELIDYFKENNAALAFRGISNESVIAWLEKQGNNPTTLPKWKYKKDNAPLLRDSLILNKYGCVAKSPSGATVSDVWVIDYDELAKLPKEESEKQGEQKPNPCENCGIATNNCQKFPCTIRDGERKPADKVEPKFHEGDMIIHKELGGDYIHNPHKIIQVDILDKKYRLEGGLVAHFGEQDDYELVEHNPAWSEEDETKINYLIALLQNCTMNNDALREMNEGIEDWLKSLKDRVQPQPEQEWSEEDEDAIAEAIIALEDMYDPDEPERRYAGYTLTFDKAAERLKSLRPQNKWKPSDEQIKAVKEAACYSSVFSEKTIDNLISLSEQLKKLREE